MHWGVCAIALCCLRAGSVYAQDSLQVSPDSLPRFSIDAQIGLTEGSLGWIRVTPAAGVTVTGAEAAGEPLHFEPGGENSLRALVGVPV